MDISTILAAVITGGMALAGVVITNLSSHRSIQAKLEKNQAVTDTKLTELTREVREHNGFAKRMPVVEEKIKTLCHRVTSLEQKGA